METQTTQKGVQFPASPFGPPVKKTNRGRKMTPFWGPENGPVFGTEKPEKWVHEVTKNNHLEVQFCGTKIHNDIEAAG